MQKVEQENTETGSITNYTGTGVWYWGDGSSASSWKKYSEELQAKIEKNFGKIHDSYSIKVVEDGNNFTIFPLAEIQVNGLTGAVRQIKKIVPKGMSEPIWHWQAAKAWQPYSDEVSHMIDGTIKQLEQYRYVEFENRSVKYQIDLFKLVQTNLTTKYQRSVIRKDN